MYFFKYLVIIVIWHFKIFVFILVNVLTGGCTNPLWLQITYFLLLGLGFGSVRRTLFLNVV